MQRKAYNSEMVRDTAKYKCIAASTASSSFSSEEYWQSFRIKWRAFRLAHLGGLLVSNENEVKENTDAVGKPVENV